MLQNFFDLAPQSEAAVMSSAGQKWRDFKNKLNSRFVWPYRDNPEKLRSPPEQYQIPSAIWKAFVDERLHPSWEVLDDIIMLYLNYYMHQDLKHFGHLINKMKCCTAGIYIISSCTAGIYIISSSYSILVFLNSSHSSKNLLFFT